MIRSIRAPLGLVALGLAALAAASAMAQESAVPPAEMIGPVVGTEAPPLSGMTSDGQAVTLDALAGENGTVIAFIRSLDWCPYCQKQAIGLEEARVPLEEAGWSLAGLSYDSQETLANFIHENGINYVLVSDPESEVIRDYGLLNEEMREGSKYWGIPHPAVVFIRADGTVAAVLREEGYKDRPQVEAVTETAVLLNEAAGG